MFDLAVRHTYPDLVTRRVAKGEKVICRPSLIVVPPQLAAQVAFPMARKPRSPFTVSDCSLTLGLPTIPKVRRFRKDVRCQLGLVLARLAFPDAITTCTT